MQSEDRCGWHDLEIVFCATFRRLTISVNGDTIGSLCRQDPDVDDEVEVMEGDAHGGLAQDKEMEGLADIVTGLNHQAVYPARTITSLLTDSFQACCEELLTRNLFTG